MALFENTIKKLKHGVRESVLLHGDFQAWFWKKVNILTPISGIDNPIFFGDIPSNMLYDFKLGNHTIMVGIPKENMYRKMKVIRKPPYMKMKLDETSYYVFGLEQVNKIGNKDDLLTYFNNLMCHSEHYVFLTCWAMDPEIPEGLNALEKNYWDMSEYIKVFKENGFNLTVRANYKDSFTMLYVFEKI